ncbi:hypothetical protein [Joostella sp.]|uniref:hypothetical protein n=1 Tax=Joostella sp. TaxID=2231138 RepID=UPI003A8E12C8
MKILKTQLANYLGVSYPTALKHYQTYLDILELKRNYLTPFDIAKVDAIPIEIVCKRMSININNS